MLKDNHVATGPEKTKYLGHVRKRDGRLVAFDKKRIENAIFKAAQAVGGEDKLLAEELSNVVTLFLKKRFGKKIPTIEQIQDIVEKVLVETGHTKTAKAYILYREKRREFREKMKVRKRVSRRSNPTDPFLLVRPPSEDEVTSWDKKQIAEALQKEAKLEENLSWDIASAVEKKIFKSGVKQIFTSLIRALVNNELFEHGLTKRLTKEITGDIITKITADFNKEVVSHYLKKEDWQIKENSNQDFSLQGLNLFASSKIIKNYWLNEVYPREIREAHTEGDLHIHDLGYLSVYCVGHDLEDLLRVGFKGAPAKAASKPPKHLRSALGQIVNFFYTLQGEAAGAQAFSSFDTLLAPFIRYDKLNYKQVKQALQEFIFNVNVPTRSGFQAPFTNVTLDLTLSPIYGKQPVVIAGEPQKEQYSDFQEEMNVFNKAFFEVMLEGDAKGRVFSFPIPTYNITKNFDWDNENLEGLWKMTAKYGIPYFSNFINSDMNPEDARSMCCRLRIDNRKLENKGGGLFGSNPLTGCYDEKTEILTTNGWKHFKDLTLNDEVFTLAKNNKIEVHKPIKLFAYAWNGDLYRFKAKSLDLLVTPNHKMVVDTRNNKRRLVPAEKFDVNNYRIPKQGIWAGKKINYFVLPSIENNWIDGNHQSHRKYKKEELKIKMDDWLKFFGIWIAEGSFDNDNIASRHGYRVFITQIDKETRKEIKILLKKFPFHWQETKNNFIITNKQLWMYLKQFGHSHDKLIPKLLKGLPKEQLHILFEWLIKGDGHIRPLRGMAKQRQITYYTASQRLADDIQEIAMKIGWAATITKRKKKTASSIKGREIHSGFQYVVGIQQSSHYRLRQNNIRLEYYKGKVYSCRVPNHTLFVRRNGKVAWSGNSIGVVTINMPRMAHTFKNQDKFFEKLDKNMNLAKESLEIKRKLIENLTEENLYPYTKFYLRNVRKRFGQYWKNHFSTIGLIGLNEACLEMVGENIASPQGKQFALEVLDHMRDKLLEFQEETGNNYNLEATPAESTAYRLARIDKDRFGDEIICANQEEYMKGAEPYYTNSSQLPVDFTDDIFGALRLQDSLQTKYTGGTVFHTFIGESQPSSESVKVLVKKICQNFKLPYFTITPTFSICPKCGYIFGEYHRCPNCGSECEVYSRVVGYLRPVSQWNQGKKEEFKQRKLFKTKKADAFSINES